MSSQFVVLWDRTNEVGGFAHGWRIKDAVASHRCRVTSVLEVTLMEENYWYTGHRIIRWDRLDRWRAGADRVNIADCQHAGCSLQGASGCWVKLHEHHWHCWGEAICQLTVALPPKGKSDMQTHSAWPIFMTGPRSQLLCKLLRWPSMGGARTQLCN